MAEKKLSRRQRLYIKSYYKELDDRKLSSATGVGVREIKSYRKKARLSRRKEPPKKLAIKPVSFSTFITKPAPPRPFTRNDWLTAAAVALIAMTVYVLTTARTVTGEDSGELISAAYSFGVCHPPGYPMWCFLGFIASHLPIPWLSVAFKVNLMSGVFAAGAAVFIALTVIRTIDWRPAAFCAGLLFAFSHTLWEQAIIAEVYTLNAFFVAGCVFFLTVWDEKRTDKWLFIFAGFFALSLGGHQTIWMLGALFAAYILVTDRTIATRRAESLLALGGIVVAGFLVYLYLPLASSMDPYLDWGNPERKNSLLNHVLRRQYTVEPGTATYSLTTTLGQVAGYFRYFAKQYTLAVGLLAVPGAVYHYFRRTRGFLLYAAIYLLTTLGIMLFANWRVEYQYEFNYRVFFIPAHMMAALWIGWTVKLVRDLMTGEIFVKVRIPRLAYVLAAAACLLPVAPLVANYGDNDKSSYTCIYDYAKNILHNVPSNSMLITAGDHNIFPFIYMQVVEGYRPDVTLVNKYGYVDWRVIRDRLVELEKDAPENLNEEQRKDRFGWWRDLEYKVISAGEQQKYENWIVRNYRRPIFFSGQRSLAGLHNYELRPEGLLFRLYAKGDKNLERPPKPFWGGPNFSETIPNYPLPVRDLAASENWRTLDDPAAFRDHTAIIIQYKRKIMEAIYRRYTSDREGKEAAERELDTAAKTFRLRRGIPGIYVNIALTYAQWGKYDEALKYLDIALDIDPRYGPALANRALLKVRLNTIGLRRAAPDKALWYTSDFSEIMAAREKAIAAKWESALADFERYKEVARGPDYDAIMGMGVCYASLGRFDRAHETFKLAIDIDRESPTAYVQMAHLYLMRDNKARAVVNLKRALDIDPQQESVARLLEDLQRQLKEEESAE